MLGTTPGWLGKVEVVEVDYDPSVISLDTLIDKAIAGDCDHVVVTRTDAQQAIAQKRLPKEARRSDDPVRVVENKYYLSRTPGRYLPLTRAQAARANVLAGKKQSFDAVLSPSQLALLRVIEAHPKAVWKDAIGVPFREAWAAATRVRATLDLEPDAK